MSPWSAGPPAGGVARLRPGVRHVVSDHLVHAGRRTEALDELTTERGRGSRDEDATHGFASARPEAHPGGEHLVESRLHAAADLLGLVHDGASVISLELWWLVEENRFEHTRADLHR